MLNVNFSSMRKVYPKESLEFKGNLKKDGFKKYACPQSVSFTGEYETELLELCKKMSKQSVECFVAITADKRVLGPIISKKDSRVDIPDEIGSQLRGSSCIHNHPDPAPPSPQDILAALKYDIKEIFVVTKDKYYSIVPNPNHYKYLFEFCEAANKYLKENRETFIKHWGPFKSIDNDKLARYLDILWKKCHEKGVLKYEVIDIK